MGLPSFVDLSKELPQFHYDLKYQGRDNFTGSPVPGYKNLNPLAHPKLFKALVKVPPLLKQFDRPGAVTKLVVFDVYRPLEAVQYFYRWCIERSEELPDEKALKQRFFPNYERQNLFKEGFLSETSSHTKGTAIDLNLAQFTHANGEMSLWDMGTEFDFFDRRSFTNDQSISAQAKQNRQLLVQILSECGLRNYSKEWWHFSVPL